MAKNVIYEKIKLDHGEIYHVFQEFQDIFIIHVVNIVNVINKK